MFHSPRRRLAAIAGAVALGGSLAVAGLAASANAAPLPPKPHAVCAVKGANVISLKDGASTYTYPARFTSAPAGSGVTLIGGAIHDGYEPVPVNLPLHGVAYEAGGTCDVVFSVQYPTAGPDAGAQGNRTFSGVLAHRHVSGAVSETGSEDLVGTFALVFPV